MIRYVQYYAAIKQIGVFNLLSPSSFTFLFSGFQFILLKLNIMATTREWASEYGAQPRRRIVPVTLRVYSWTALIN